MQSAPNEDSEPGKKWTGPFLDQMRLTADPLADDVVGALFKNHDIDAVNNLWTQLLHHDGIPEQDLPEEIRPYLAASGALPSWANPDLIAKAQQLFVDRGFFCLLTLLSASLPECYVLKNESEVLGTTRDLTNHAFRRVLETAQLIIAVMIPGGLTTTKKGIAAAQKVRLMHAAIRHLILHVPRHPENPAKPATFKDAVQKMPPWDVVRLGVPVNQEDLAYTLLTFSYVTVRAFQTMKVRISKEEITAYLHCWNVVGHIMGIREELLAPACADAGELFKIIKERQLGQGPSGEALAAALIACSRQIISRETDGLLVRAFIHPLPIIFMHELLDKSTLSTLKIPRLTFWQYLARQIIRFFIAPFESLYQKLMARFGLLVVDYLTALPQRWQRSLFAMPEEIKTTWRKKRGG